MQLVYVGSGCSPQGLVDSMSKSPDSLSRLSSLARSMKKTPGSPRRQAFWHSLFQSSSPETVRTTLPLARERSAKGRFSRAAPTSSSETQTEMLKYDSLPSSVLASMNCSMSGWSSGSIPISAARRRPPCTTTQPMVFHVSMNETGPDALPPVPPLISAPRSRRRPKLPPTPPPYLLITAASRTESKMPSMLSGMSITKHAKSCWLSVLPS